MVLVSCWNTFTEAAITAWVSEASAPQGKLCASTVSICFPPRNFLLHPGQKMGHHTLQRLTTSDTVWCFLALSAYAAATASLSVLCVLNFSLPSLRSMVQKRTCH